MTEPKAGGEGPEVNEHSELPAGAIEGLVAAALEMAEALERYRSSSGLLGDSARLYAAAKGREAVRRALGADGEGTP